MQPANRVWWHVVLLVSICIGGSHSTLAQHARGELHIEVRDQQGAALTAVAELVSYANQFHRTFVLEQHGQYVAQDLPFGTYKLTLSAAGFAPHSELVAIRSEAPVRVVTMMTVSMVATEVQVNDSATLVDPHGTSTSYAVGRRSVAEHVSAQPGRSLTDLVDEQPGWLYESNGILHPRGSEYDVQYVTDGVPLTDNRSPAFAPSVDTRDVGEMRVLTAGYPAEYGRKLGGVIEVTTDKNVAAGLHGVFSANGGSFDTSSGSLGLSYARDKNRFELGANGFHTDRYLDPPVLANYTNRATSDGVEASYERDLTDSDRLRLSFARNAVRFLVPNELVQQEAGQRQDNANTEASGTVDFQHTFAPDLLLNLAANIRDASTSLSSNQESVPVVIAQNRGFREGYVRGDLAGHRGHHDFKFGVDGVFTPVHESLSYRITDPTQFDDNTRQNFSFADRRWDVEPSAYVQDRIHWGNWNISAGLRFDHYGFVVHESAWSPRLGISRYFSSLNLLVHGSYDRVFQTPAVENLLLASSPQLDSVNELVVRLPVRPARANYYEFGITKAIVSNLRIDANVFRRDFRNYSDDDVLLDTGVSFPIAFSNAQITGEEVRLVVPGWGRFSGYLSYANQSGSGRGPITGGLFLGDEASGLADRGRFPVSQDQRNTARARVRFQADRRVWFAMGGQYGSGLPSEITGADPNFLLAQYGPEVLRHVNFERNRVRPNFSLDAQAGVEVYHREQSSVVLQVQSSNLTDRLNVINFASLFSGTAIAPQRSISASVRLAF